MSHKHINNTKDVDIAKLLRKIAASIDERGIKHDSDYLEYIDGENRVEIHLSLEYLKHE